MDYQYIKVERPELGDMNEPVIVRPNEDVTPPSPEEMLKEVLLSRKVEGMDDMHFRINDAVSLEVGPTTKLQDLKQAYDGVVGAISKG